MPQQFDVSKLTQSASRKVTPHDNCIVLDLDLDGVGASVYPRYIEVRLPDDEGPRQTALWDGALNLAVDDEVLCHEYAGNSTWRVMAMGGADSGAGRARVSEIWESDFGAVAMEADATGQIGIGTASPGAQLEVSDSGSPLSVSPLTISADTSTHILQITGNVATSSSPQLLRFVPIINPTGAITSIFGANINPQIGGSSSNNVTTLYLNNARLRFISAYNGTVSTLYNYRVQDVGDTSSGTPGVTTQYAYYAEDLSFATNTWAFYAAGNTRSFFGGYVGIGISPPQGILHTYDTISGSLKWEYDGLDATVRTVIPNGAGDVLYRLVFDYIIRSSAGVAVSSTIGMPPAAASNITVGADTVTITANADGSVTANRSAGTNTHKITLTLRWL